MKNFSYKVILKNRIDSSDDKILSYLYQPIIGLRSISIYKLLIFEAEVLKEFKKAEFREERLLTLCKLNADQFQRQLKKLEGIGLLTKMVNEQKNSVILNVYAPLEPCDFFNNALFNKALIKKIGEKDYEMARFVFRDEGEIPSDSGYKNATSKFLEVFEEFNNSLGDIKVNSLKTKPKRTNALLKGFDFEKIVLDLEKEDIYISKSDTTLKNKLEEIYSGHNFELDKIIEAVKESYDKESLFLDVKKIYRVLSNNYFEDEQFNTSEEIFDPKVNMQNYTNKKIKEMETIEPTQYLQLLMNIENLELPELELISKLSKDYKLRNGVINCLLEFSYLKNDEKIVANYLYKIASTINERQIVDAKETMEYLKVAHKKGAKGKKFIPDQFSPWEEVKSNKGYMEKTSSNGSGFDETLWGKL
ncbi:chromosome replication initiation and membrane attachment protein [Spiroplasma chinense]|uniref:Chromosome replication initiation and membrane attachment protein n=1 Tax=Spiroplasma chinense TaxID=216932 RepID=A0A5B9Y7C0_9MOLU|nr:DnaD domain protein [Spiroplasma chinense]QEH62207.1 chromosome replication initiation and membrane attachment protein [Spiroplasma chinense]